MTFHHGITGNEPTSGLVYVNEKATSIIGLVAFADDADEEFFPLDTPVRLNNMLTGIAKAGYGGNLRRCLETIQAIVNTTVVVVRIQDPFFYGEGGTELDDSIVIGGVDEGGYRTGIQALLTAKSLLGITPKINIAPDVETPDVIQALISVNQKLRGFSYCTPRDSYGDMLGTMEEAVSFRDSVGARELMLLYPELISGNVLIGYDEGEGSGE